MMEIKLNRRRHTTEPDLAEEGITVTSHSSHHAETSGFSGWRVPSDGVSCGASEFNRTRRAKFRFHSRGEGEIRKGSALVRALANGKGEWQWEERGHVASKQAVGGKTSTQFVAQFEQIKVPALAAQKGS